MIVDALAAHFGGHAIAATEISRRLPAIGAIDRVVVVAPAASLVAEGLRDVPGVELLTPELGGHPDVVRRIVWEARHLPPLAAGADVAGVLSWSGMLPRAIRPRLVCCLSNRAAFDGSGAANALRRLAIRRTAARASSLLVPSEPMIGLVEEFCGRRPDLIPWGVDHERLSPAPEPGDELLCVADYYRHKRQDLTLRIWAGLPGPRPPLRLIGDSRVDPEFFASVTESARRLREEGAGRVLIEDRRPFADLIALYRRARAFLLPSTLESFCLPLLEAQACGVPCVITDLDVLRGTAGAGASYIDAEAPVEAWSAAVGRLLADDGAHLGLREAAISNAARFSWERTASMVADRLLGHSS